MQRLQSFSALVSLTASFWVFQPLQATAQLIPDNSLGNESSVVVPNVNINGIDSDRIDGGAIRGSNLFHSFQEFNIDNGRGAYFSNPGNISNILTRVTGSNLSNILGTLGVLGNANLFLINPNGIVFGPNARLDVGGSFFASTADSILFENGVEFAASNPDAPPLLTINIPIGLNFRENPGSIVNQSIAVNSEDNLVGLQVLPRRTLGLIGGDIQLENSILTASQGRIELGSVAGNSIVNLTPIDKGYALSYENVPNFQDIVLSQAAFVDVRGEGGGDIQIQGRRVTLADNSIIDADTQGSEPGGLLSIQASESVEIFGGGIFADASSDATATGGSITINTQNLRIQDGGQIGTGTFGSGDGGDLTVIANEIELIGTSAEGRASSGLFTDIRPGATGNGGALTINTQRLLILDGAQVFASTFGNGNGGNLTVTATDVEVLGRTMDGQIPSALFTSVGSTATGNAGTLTIDTQRLLVQDGAGISASAFGSGQGGTLTINTRQLSVNNQGRILGVTNGLGQGGTININASEFVELSGSSVISGTGTNLSETQAGNITIETGRLTVEDSSQINSSTFGRGNAGNVTIRAEQIELIGRGENPSAIQSNVEEIEGVRATGNGGNILIEAQQLTLKEGAGISASTRGSGNAGSLTIRAEALEITGELSSISSQVNRGATGQGGIVTIESGRLIVQDGATLSVNTLGSGQGGIFTINTGQLFVNNQGQILGVTDGLGQGGTININASEFIELSDNSLISGTSTNLSQAQTGNITVETGRLTVEDDSGIVVDTLSPARGGQLTIRAEQLIINNNSVVSALSSGLGQAGTINVNASEFIELSDGSGITTQTQQQGDANAGDITVETGRLTVEGGSQINNSTSGGGDAGNVTIRAEQIELIGRGENPSAIQSNVDEIEGVRGAGNGGNVIIEAQQLTIKEGAGISASTRGSGNAGSLTIRAEAVEITGELSSIGSQVNRGATGQGGVVTLESGQLIVQDRGNISVGTLSTGQGGTLIINTGQLIIQDGGSITARTEGLGQGGNLNVNASELILVSGSAIFSDGRLNLSSLETTTFTSAKAGDLTIATGQLIIEDGGQIAASTSGSGDGGNLTVQASEIELIGTFNDGQQEAPSGLFVDVGLEATGRGGALAVNTDRLILREGGQIDASTFGSGSGGELTIRANEIELTGRSASGIFPSGLFTGVNSGIEDFDNEATGNGGELNIEAERLTLKDGAEISVETSSIGNAGNLIIDANEIKVSGFAEGERLSAISARTTEGSQGDGGTLKINSEVVSVENQAQIVVSSQGEGVAGNLNINASSVFLDNQASLNGETTAGEGDIILNTDDLRLRNHSNITTNATGVATGGNITINTETLTAIENSDISANAEDAFGGRVTINATGVFGTAFRTQQSQFSDITATSELGPEFSGTVELNTELDPSSGLIDLTQTVTDPSDLIAQEFCRQRGTSAFTITGRGGIAISPNDKSDGNQINVDLVEPVPSQPRNSSQKRSETEDNQPISSLDIVPARGWIRDENGDVILVSYDPTKTGVRRQPSQFPQCQP